MSGRKAHRRRAGEVFAECGGGLERDVHEALAAVHRKSEFDWDGTIRESRQALKLNPKAAMPHFYIAGALYHLGMLAEAEQAVRAGLDLTSVPDRAEALRCDSVYGAY